MLQTDQLAGFTARRVAAGGGSVTLTAQTLAYENTGTGSAGTDNTLSSVAIGTDSGSTKCYILSIIRSFSGNEFTNSETVTMTVGGNSATIEGQVNDDLGSNGFLGVIASIDHPGGTTADIVMTWTTSVGRCRHFAQVFTTDDASSVGEVVSSINSSSNSFTLSNLTVAANGAAIAGFYHDNSAGSGLTVLTTDTTATNDGDLQMTGSDDNMSSGDISPVFSVTSASFGAAIAASINPA